MPGVLLVGDVIDDVVVRPAGPIAPDTDTPSRIDRVAGGSAANTACRLAADGTPATLVATVGAEDVERHSALLRLHGVVPRLRASARSTGTIVVLSTGGERAMLTDRGANEETVPADVPDALLAAHGALHVTGHAMAGGQDDDWRDLFARATRLGLLVSVAPGSAGMLAGFGPRRFAAMLPEAGLVVASAAEATLLTAARDPAEALRLLADRHGRAVVTLGAEGALVREAQAEHHVPAVPARVVDVTGAGDAFVAGVLAGLLAGRPLHEAAMEGAASAARAIERVGARP